MQKSVVIIDDSRFMAALLEIFFTEKMGLRVLAMGNNGVQAVSLFKQHRPDLMTMDITMPVKDGKTALMEILAEYPEAKILMITSQLGPTIVECLKIGAAGYIEKPLMLENEEFVREFTEAVNTALSGKSEK